MPFDVRGGRAMVSLGPMSSHKYCTYSCPFCYVGGEFLSYASLTADEIADWVASVDPPVNIVYVSCDTDSFAPPRERQAMDLLEKLTSLKVDLLFTTRAILPEEFAQRLEGIARQLHFNGNMLVGCVSLVQLSRPHLEPLPIPSPDRRIAQLHHFRQLGVRTILALRPFLPVVPAEEYVRIVQLCSPSAEVVLGGVWYADAAGELQAAISTPEWNAMDSKYVDRRMDFDRNNAMWRVFEGTGIEVSVRRECKRLGLPMFMRSAPAVDWLRTHGPK